MSLQALPKPLTPAGCDLRDFPKMMIDVPRLFASTFNASASRSPLAWMIGHKLWYRSWHQVPAGSLPNDDDELCHLAELGFDAKSFAKAKALAMRGWIECDDGRLYHHVVCEAALEAWQEKLRQRLASGTGNAKRWGVSFDPSQVAADLRALISCMAVLNPQSKAIMKAQKSLKALSGVDEGTIPQGPKDDPTGIAEASHRDIEKPGISSLGTGTGTGNLFSDANASVAHPAPRGFPAGFEEFWAAYPNKVGKKAAAKAFPAALKSIGGPAPLAVILEGLARAVVSRRWNDPTYTKPNPATWLNQGRWEDEHEPATSESSNHGRQSSPRAAKLDQMQSGLLEFSNRRRAGG